MPAPLRRTLLCLSVALLAFLAHAPLFGAGFVGGDLDLLAAAAGSELRGESNAWLAHGALRPLPAAILRAHADLHAGLSPIEPAVAGPYFAFALLLLLVGASGAGVALRRVLVPWLGESAARAAGWACAGLVAAHPVGVVAVARPAALGDLVAFAAGAWCTAFFLRGRQQRRPLFLALAVALAVAAGFSSGAAWLLPILCAGLEFGSAHRPRSSARKLGAALVVALVAVAAVAVETALAWSADFGTRGDTPWAALGARAAAGPEAASGFDPLDALSALGVLFLPAPAPAAAGYWLACGAILVLGAEPLLRAVRAAPRMWGWLALAWVAAIASSFLVVRDLAVPPGRIELGAALLVPAVIVCVALATASTALGGSRRTLIPLAIATLLCVLADRTARVWPAASRELLTLRSDLDRGLAAAEGGRVWVVGAPEPRRALLPDVDALRGDFEMGWELDVVAGTWPPDRRGPDRLVRVRAADVPYLLRVPPGADARRGGLAVLLLDREERPVFRIPGASGDVKSVVWRDEYYGKSPEGVEFDPLADTMVRVTPRAGIAAAQPPRLRWRATNAVFETGTIEGAWIATDDGPQAVFDLGRSLEWALGGRIRRITFEGDLLRFVTAEVLTNIPLDGLARTESGVAFDPPAPNRPRAWSGEPEWTGLLVYDDVGRVVERAGPVGTDGRIAIDFTPPFCLANPPWHLVECRVGGVTVARTPPLGPADR